MSTSQSDMQVQNQLAKILDVSQEIRATVDTNQVLQILEAVRDQVNRLSREHESIRDQIRDARNHLTTATGSD